MQNIIFGMEAHNELYIGGLDDFFAETLIKNGERPIKLSIRRAGDQGCVFVNLLRLKENESIEENGVDFELSPCECAGLDGINAADFMGRTVFTSSAFEFFNFLFMFLDSLECLADFGGNGWKVKITSGAPISD